MSTIITSVFEPKQQLGSKDGMKLYTGKLAELQYPELCQEFSNVLSAKHNQIFSSTSLSDHSEKQALVYDLTSRATLICLLTFGQETVKNFCGSDLTQLNELVNSLDEQVAKQNLGPEAHGNAMFGKLQIALTG
jgi:hypothetical protein